MAISAISHSHLLSFTESSPTALVLFHWAAIVYFIIKPITCLNFNAKCFNSTNQLVTTLTSEKRQMLAILSNVCLSFECGLF